MFKKRKSENHLSLKYLSCSWSKVNFPLWNPFKHIFFPQVVYIFSMVWIVPLDASDVTLSDDFELSETLPLSRYNLTSYCLFVYT